MFQFNLLLKQFILPFCFRNALFLIFMLVTFSANAQSTQIQGEMCGTSLLHNQRLQKDPAFAARVQSDEKRLLASNQNRALHRTSSSQVRVVPLVVHILQDGTSLTQISKEQITDAIKGLNERFRKVAGSVGDGNGLDMEIEFALAVRDPDGNCTDGIKYWNISSQPFYNNYVANGISSGSGNLGVDELTLKSAVRWDPTKYYNIYIVGKINGPVDVVAGYAILAGGGAHGIPTDGTVIQAKYMAAHHTTLTHELGHAFDLYHTFEGDNGGGQCPTNTNCATDGDRVCDIPPHKRSSNSCTPGANSCDGGTSSELYTHNYMDYSGPTCQNEFTAGQKLRVVFAIDSLRKSFLASEGNMSLVPPVVAGVNFIKPTEITCKGSTLTFIDNSSCTPNTFLAETVWPGISFAWTIKRNGTSIHTSTKQNLTYTFNDTGFYSIKLQVTNSQGTSSKTDTVFITNPSTVTVCTPTSFNPPNNYDATVNNVTFNTINNTTSLSANGEYEDFSCTKSTIVNAGQTYQLSVSIRSNTNSQERFEAYIDYNNNGIFEKPSELVSAGTGTLGQNITFTGSVTISDTAVMGKLLRMRIIGDVDVINNNKLNCSQVLTIGDVEDYGIYIMGTPPVVLCPIGDVTLTTQAQVDAFVISYTNCKQITGNLTISGPSNITNLNGLSSIETITGQLNIVHNENLTNLSGLDALKTVGSNFWVADNSALTTISGFSSLETVSQFYIGENNLLTTINGFDALTTSGQITIQNNAQLTNFNGLNTLTNASSNINISNNLLLQQVTGLKLLTTIGGHLNFVNNAKLQNISGLSKVATIGGNLNFNNNSILQHVNSLSQLTTIGAHLSFTNNAQLQNIDSLSKLISVTGVLQLVNNSQLQHVNGFNKLTTVGGNLNLINNLQLQHVNGFNKLATVGGFLQFWNNAQLVDINGVSKVTQINGALYIGNNPVLQNINGLGALQSVGEGLEIDNNDQLQSLDSLSSLTQTGEYIYIVNNALLSNISGLQNTTFNSSTSSGLTIRDNPSLAVCNLPNFCSYLANPAATHLRTISGNLSNCLNEAAVIAACTAPPPSNIKYVKANATGNNNGSSWANAYPDLQQAINAVNVNDTIFVATGTYKPNRPANNLTNIDSSNRNNAFVLKAGVKMFGGFAGTETSLAQRVLNVTSPTILSGDIDNNNIVDAGNSYHVVVSAGNVGTAVLDGFTIKQGNANSFGTTITVNSFSIDQMSGGGIINYSSSPTITNCTITQNTSIYDGGGMVNYQSSSPVISKCIFSGNYGQYGGAMENSGNSNPLITNCIFSGNFAAIGGAIENYSNAKPIITNCTFSGNSGSGVIYSYDASTSPIITNSILYGNSSGISGSFVSAAYSLVQGESGGANGNIDGSSNPLFVNAPSETTAPFTGGDYRLQTGSPVINFGTTDTTGLQIGNTDIAGKNRIQDSRIDMGAYEYNMTHYYTSGNHSANILANWKSNANGTGTSPLAFNEPADFTVQTGHTITLNNGVSVDIGNNDLIVQTGATIDGTELITTGGTLTNNGSIAATVLLYGTLPQFIKGKGTINSLALNNPAGANIAANDSVYITDRYTPILGVLTTNNGLVLKSTATSMARITATNIIGNYIDGNVIVERFIPAKRAYRFIASPVNTTTTIRANWQEGGTVENGKGTHITGAGGAANGFDVTATNSASLFTLNPSTQSWASIANTNIANLSTGTGYRLMIRGDRTVNLSSNNPLATNTVLRSTGTITGGNVTNSNLSTTTNGYSLVGNPYASPIDWEAVTKNNINPVFYVWDPTLSGANGRGAYVAYNAVTQTNNNPSSLVDKNIQLGQAFMVQTIGNGAASLSFTENMKTTENRSVFRTNNQLAKIAIQLFVQERMQEGVSADGATVVFDKNFKMDKGLEDADKIGNLDENISFNNNGKLYSIEGRPLLTAKDTVNVEISQLSASNYVLRINGTNLASAFKEPLTAYLYDALKGSKQELLTNTQLDYSFEKTDKEVDKNRFSIVFKKQPTLPIQADHIDLKVFPNPASQFVQVLLNTSEKGKAAISIISANGKQVHLSELGQTSTINETINIRRLTKGNYFVQVAVGNQTFVQKLTIQ